MAFLYVNPKGYEVTRHSYSAGQTFNECGEKYRLQRVVGYQEIRQNAAMKFGDCVEHGWRAYHESGLQHHKAVTTFVNEWKKFEKDQSLVYSASEGDWDSLRQSGIELMRLYDLLLSTFPINRSVTPRFQIPIHREVFPGTTLAGIEDWAYLDAMMKSNNNEDTIVDCKTSGADAPEPLYVALDPQLRDYAWISGINRVAFLWFKKNNRTIEKGTQLTLLDSVNGIKAGTTVHVIKFQETDHEKFQEEQIWIVPSLATIERMKSQCGTSQKKAEKEAREAFIQQNAVLVKRNQVTKQAVYFIPAVVSDAWVKKAGDKIARDIVAIKHSSDNGFTDSSGVRFPFDKCPKCAMRGICAAEATNDPVARAEAEKLRDQLVVLKTDYFAAESPAPEPEN